MSPTSFRSRAAWIVGSVASAVLAACGEDAPVGTPASLSVAGGGAAGSAGEGAAGVGAGVGTAGAASGAGTGGADAGTSGNAGAASGAGTGGADAGTSGNAGAGAAPSAGAGGAAGANVGGQSAAGTSGSSQGGNASGGSDPGTGLPEFGPLYHVSCLLAVGGGDPAKAIRFAGKYTALAGGLRIVYLQALKVGTKSLDDVVGPVLKGESESQSSDGEPVYFGQVTILGEANPISGSTFVVDDAILRLVIAGPENRPCGELDGKLTTPLQVDFADPSSIDTCLFDPVSNETTPTPPVSDANRFVPCRRP